MKSTKKTFRFSLNEYYRTSHWQKKSVEMRQKIGRCQLCGVKTDLQVHHNCYDNLGREIDLDLTVLCRNCHERYHDKKTENDLMW